MATTKNTTKGRSGSQQSGGSQRHARPGSGSGSSPSASPSLASADRLPGADGDGGSPKRRPRGKSGRQQQPAKQSGTSRRGGRGANGQQRGAATRAVETVKGHPYAASAVGASMALLAFQGVRMALAARADAEPDVSAEDESQVDAADESEDEDDEGDQGEKAAGSGWGFSRVGSALRSGASSVGQSAQSGFRRGREAAMESAQGHPLTLAAAALVAGTTLGLLLPRTGKEDQVMGGLSDRWAGKLKRAGRELLGQGRDIATRAISEGASAVAEEVEREGLSPQRLGRKIRRVASHVRDSVASAVTED